MQRTVLSAMALALAAAVGSALAAPVNYKTPDEVAAFKPGPNLEVVQGNRNACRRMHWPSSEIFWPRSRIDPGGSKGWRGLIL